MLLPIDSASCSWGSAVRGSTLAESVRSLVATRRVLFLLADPLRAAVLVQEDEPPADAEGEAARSAPLDIPGLAPQRLRPRAPGTSHRSQEDRSLGER